MDVTNKPNSHKKPGDRDKNREQKDAGKEDEDANLSFAQLENDTAVEELDINHHHVARRRINPKRNGQSIKPNKIMHRHRPLHRAQVRLPLLLPTSHCHHKLHNKQLSIELDGQEFISNYNF